MVGLVLLFASCQKTYDEPGPEKFWTQEELAAANPDYEFMTIWDFKERYYYSRTWPNMHGPNKVEIPDKVFISGKVISTDQPGNIYRSIYIQDETGAMELKIGLTGLYNDYKVGQRIFVRTDGLILGNYRYMLSLGSESSDVAYANGYIDRVVEINRTIIKGEIEGFRPGDGGYASDTIVVNSSNINTKLRDPQDLGRLVRFEEIRSVWGRGEGDGFSVNDVYPSFLYSRTEGNVTSYQDYLFETVIAEWQAYLSGQTTVRPTSPRPGLSETEVDPPYPTWAFKGIGNNFYGSALFELGGKYMVVRSSGYSLFALVELPKHNETIDMTAMYHKFSSGSGGFMKYQLLLNTSNDVVKPGTNEPAYYFDRSENTW